METVHSKQFEGVHRKATVSLRASSPFGGYREK